MGQAIYHARSTAQQFGGKPEDYLDIHEFIDSSREAMPDLRHRALTHNSWFIGKVICRIFGHTRRNSDNQEYSVKRVAEIHVLEDFGMLFIPSVQDFLGEMRLRKWMDNARGDATPPSRGRVAGKTKKVPPARQGESRKASKKPGRRKVRIPKDFLDARRTDFASRPCANAGPGMID